MYTLYLFWPIEHTSMFQSFVNKHGLLLHDVLTTASFWRLFLTFAVIHIQDVPIQFKYNHEQLNAILTLNFCSAHLNKWISYSCLAACAIYITWRWSVLSRLLLCFRTQCWNTEKCILCWSRGLYSRCCRLQLVHLTETKLCGTLKTSSCLRVFYGLLFIHRTSVIIAYNVGHAGRSKMRLNSLP